MKHPCNAWQDQIAELVSGTLPEKRAGDIERHANGCASCHAYLAALRGEHERLAKHFAGVREDAGRGMRQTVEAVRELVRAQTTDPDASRPAVRPFPDMPPGWAGSIHGDTHPIKQVPQWRHARTRFLVMLKLRPVRWSLAAAVAAAVIFIIIPVGWFSIAPLKPVYALEQTAAALGGKRSFHVKLWSPPDQLKEEFWAEFRPDGSTLRFRQEEESQTTVWQDKVKSRYFPEMNILMLTRSNGQENILERTDPELTVQHLLRRQAEGKATVEIRQPSAGQQSDLTVVATHAPTAGGLQLRNVLLVDAKTYIVKRVELWRQNEGNWEPDCSLDVLEYNQPIPQDTFELDAPADAVVIDQVNQQVGVPQDKSSIEELAVGLVQQTLESWQAGRDSEAALLFGGIQPDYLTRHLAEIRPVGGISVGQPIRGGKSNSPFFEVPCRWNVQRVEGMESIRRTLTVRGEPPWQRVDNQPIRWWVDIRTFVKPSSPRAARQGRSEVGLEQGALNDKEIVVRVVREMLEALMAEDYAKAGRLVGGVPAEKMRERMKGRKVLRIVSIGEPEPHEGRADHYRVVVKLEGLCQGVQKVVEETFSVEPVEGQPGYWEID